MLLCMILIDPVVSWMFCGEDIAMAGVKSWESPNYNRTGFNKKKIK